MVANEFEETDEVQLPDWQVQLQEDFPFMKQNPHLIVD